MNDLLTEAKLIIANNKSEKAARDFMTTEQRNALAEDYAANNQFLSASHFTPDAENRKEFERLFWEDVKPKNN
ncbi:MAG: hypothetical protein M3388_08325 [Acidobacteriota bacterium]|nr:hypothetical protein [Acidobacteriota bacterium]